MKPPLEVSAGPGLSALDDWLPLFSGAVAMTSNGIAEISEAGAYAQPLRPGDDVLDVARRVTLRASSVLNPQVRVTPPDPGQRTGPSVELWNDTTLLHRCVLTSPKDARLVEGDAPEPPDRGGEWAACDPARVGGARLDL